MLWRASSKLSFLPATTCASVGGGGAAGVSRRCPVVTRVWGRRGGCARRGWMTSIFGSAVVPLPAGAAVCDIAVPPRPSSSDAELERRRVLLATSVIVPILMSHGRIRPCRRILVLACRRPATGRFQGVL